MNLTVNLDHLQYYLFVDCEQCPLRNRPDFGCPFHTDIETCENAQIGFLESGDN